MPVLKNPTEQSVAEIRITSVWIDLWGGTMDVTDMSSNLLSACDVAVLLGCSLERVRRYRADGALSAFYVGTQPVFRRVDVESLGRRIAAASCFGSRVAFGAGVRGERVVQALLCDTSEFAPHLAHST